MSPLDPLVALCHHRWVLPLLVTVGPSGTRFAVAMRRLDVARPTLRRALDAGVEGGWVRSNPGYGHPLRPEYLLTDEGLRLAPAAGEVLTVCAREGFTLAGRKWSLPVLAALEAGPQRFSARLARLGRITPRALSTTLEALVDDGWVERVVGSAHPPRPVYGLSVRGEPVAAVALELARVAAQAGAHVRGP